VQHALRAFTPDDDKALKATANTFPRSEFYDIPRTILSLGIGEAIVTVLGERGIPTPVVATRMAPPASLMGPIPASERSARVARSPLMAEFGTPIDRESAREMLLARTESAATAPAPHAGRGSVEAPTVAESVGKAINSPLARAVGRELVRGLFGVLGVSTTRRRRRRIF
jgi:hypothetical protein